MHKVTFTDIGPVDLGVPGRHLHLHQCDECGSIVRIGHNETGLQRHIQWHHRIHELVEYPARQANGSTLWDRDISREEPRA